MRPEAALYAAAEFVLLLDGVCVDGEDGPQFVAAPPVSDDDAQQTVETTAQRVVRLLDEGHADPLMEQEPLLATLTAASIQGQVGHGRTRRPARASPPADSRCGASGFRPEDSQPPSVHPTTVNAQPPPSPPPKAEKNP